MLRAVLVLALASSAMAGAAQATDFRVVVRPDLDLRAYADRGAIGLLVPDAGPTTSAARARAALVRGEVRNSLRGGLPAGPPLLELDTRSTGERGPIILIALPRGGEQRNDRRYPIAVVGPGYSGLLVSESTRIPGLVSIADVAPTALGRDDGLRSQAADDPLGELAALDRAIREHNDARIPATILFAALVVVLAVVFPRAGLIGLAVGLAANLALGSAQVTALWAVLLAVGLAVAAGGPLLARVLRGPAPLAAALAGVLLAYLAVMAADPAAVALSPFGPTQNARFYGVSNLLETFFLVPALAGAWLLAARLGALGFAAVAGVALVAVAGTRFGADAGGAVVLAAGYAVLLAVALPRRAAVGATAAALAAVALLLAADVLTGAASHVTDALREGPSGLAADLRERVELSWRRATSSAALATALAGGVVLLAAGTVRLLRTDADLARKAVPLAVAAAVAVSLVVNDSPNDVLLAGLTGLAVTARAMLGDPCVAPSSSWSWRSSWAPAEAARPSSPVPRR